MPAWLTLISAIGIGGLLVKVLDIIWLQKITEDQNRKHWLRDEKFKAYSKLTEALISFGFKDDLNKAIFHFRALSASALLLIQDATKRKKISALIMKMGSIGNEKIKDKDKLKQLVIEIDKEIEETINFLQEDLLRV
jgi:hypothetical protein